MSRVQKLSQRTLAFPFNVIDQLENVVTFIEVQSPTNVRSMISNVNVSEFIEVFCGDEKFAGIVASDKRKP